MAYFRSRRRRRYGRRKMRLRFERQYLKLPRMVVDFSGQQQYVTIFAAMEGAPLPRVSANINAMGQLFTGYVVKNVVLKFDKAAARYGLHWYCVFVPYQNQALTGTPVVQVSNTGNFPISAYEPNQHVLGHGTVTDDRVAARVKGRRLRSGDSIALIIWQDAEEPAEGLPENYALDVDVDLSIARV